MAQLTCRHCGEALTAKDFYECEAGYYCEACYDDETVACAWCEARYPEDAMLKDYLVVFDADAAGVVLAGVYRIREQPYFVQPLIGHGWLGPLPAGLENVEDYPCGHLCPACRERMLGVLATEHRLIADVA